MKGQSARLRGAIALAHTAADCGAGIVTGYPGDATENAVHANMIAAGFTK